jgi:malate dehydrogenase
VNRRKKIALIGAGQIGGTLALLVAMRKLGDVVLFDVVEGMPQGKALDLSHLGAVFDCDCDLTGSNNIVDIQNADVCVVTSGVARKPGMSRDDLLEINSGIIRNVGEGIKKYAPESLVIVITNPLDAMVYLMQQVTGFPCSRVVGMAGVLDAARYRCFLSQELKVSVSSVSAFVMGGHGDTMVPVRSFTTVNGIPVQKLLDSRKLDDIEARVRQTGGEIVGLLKTGSAYYSPAASTIRMIEAYLFDEKKVLPAAAACSGEYGVKGIYLGVPVVMGGGGVEKILEIDLSSDESEQLSRSIAAVQELVESL